MTDDISSCLSNPRLLYCPGQAHKRLDDAAMLEACGWSREVGDEEGLARRLRLKAKRVEKVYH